MSELLDDLARSLAEPMPRRRALRVVAVTLAGAMVSGRGVMTAAATNSAGCPNPGDMLCPGAKCPSVNGFHYPDVCCTGPDASTYWECDCKPGVGGYNGCKRKTGCEISCGGGCCDSATEKCCHSRCFPKDMGECCSTLEAAGACPAGTHCCLFFSAYEEMPKDAAHQFAGVACCPDGWECCSGRCCAPGTHCIDQAGKIADPKSKGVQGWMCEYGHMNSKKGTKPVPWAKTIPAPPSN
jgi:hypothetical protein